MLPFILAFSWVAHSLPPVISLLHPFPMCPLSINLNSIEKWTKVMNRQLTEKEIPIADERMKSCSISLRKR
jgi:hypothetical protein